MASFVLAIEVYTVCELYSQPFMRAFDSKPKDTCLVPMPKAGIRANAFKLVFPCMYMYTLVCICVCMCVTPFACRHIIFKDDTIECCCRCTWQMDAP